MPELKLYTIAQLRAWVMHNNAVEGLSEEIISHARAWALVHNPYVKDEDPVVAAIFVDEENAAYCSAFPELIGENRYWWFCGLWCNPKYQGNGYGLIVIGSLAEEYGAEFCLDRWGAEETVEIFTYLGHKTVYTTRYHVGPTIHRNSTKEKIVYGIRQLQTKICRFFKRYEYEDYALRYLSNIDDATYDFICAHSSRDYLKHTQEYLNWGLHYPFTISAPMMDRVMNKMPFAQAELPDTQTYAVQVIEGKNIIGIYIMKRKEDSLHVLYLFYDNEHQGKVFASIRDHILRMQSIQCVTENRALADYLRKNVYFSKFTTSEISCSYPKAMPKPEEGSVQYGDGDCFVV